MYFFSNNAHTTGELLWHPPAPLAAKATIGAGGRHRGRLRRPNNVRTYVCHKATPGGGGSGAPRAALRCPTPGKNRAPCCPGVAPPRANGPGVLVPGSSTPGSTPGSKPDSTPGSTPRPPGSNPASSSALAPHTGTSTAF